MPLELVLLLLVLESPPLLDEVLNLEEADFFGRKPLPAERGAVDEEEEGGDAEADGEDALEDKDLAPTLVAAYSVHLCDCGGEEA